MLDWLIQGLKPMVQHKILKDNPTTFSNACIIAEIISWLDDYLGEMHPSAYAYPQCNSKHSGMQ